MAKPPGPLVLKPLERQKYATLGETFENILKRELNHGGRLMDYIENYFNTILYPRFKEYGLNEETIDKVGIDIRTRLYSLLYNWSNIEIRRTLLVTCIEEAYFYEPPRHIEVRCLVLLAIRNSLLEDLASTNEAAKLLGLRKTVIPEQDIRKFTSDAINYFSNIDIIEISKSIKKIENDIYGSLIHSYPAAWGILRELGNIVFQNKKYTILTDVRNTNIQSDVKLTTVDIEEIDQHFKKTTVVLSGMDPNIDPYLSDVLKAISKGYPFFFTDSFKSLTRNPEKLFRIMELVLTSNASFVSCNFYLSRDYVSYRSVFLRPMHSEKELLEKLKNKNGLTKTHLNALKFIMKSMT